MPTWRRSSISRCASAACSSGKVAPTSGFTAPVAPRLEHLVRRLVDAARRQPHEAAEVEAEDREVAPDEQLRVERRPRPARVADRDQRPERVHHADAPREDVAADRVEHDVGLHGVRELVVAVRLRRSEAPRQLPLLLRRGGRDDPGPEEAGDLDRGAADAAGARVDEHRRAGPDAHVVERHPRRQEGHQERGALLERCPVREREHPVGVDFRALGVAATGVAEERHHAASVELARDLGAGRGRQRRRLRVAALAHEHVEEVHPGGAHRDGVAVRLGHLLDAQQVGVARLAEDDRSHLIGR